MASIGAYYDAASDEYDHVAFTDSDGDREVLAEDG